MASPLSYAILERPRSGQATVLQDESGIHSLSTSPIPSTTRPGGSTRIPIEIPASSRRARPSRASSPTSRPRPWLADCERSRSRRGRHYMRGILDLQLRLRGFLGSSLASSWNPLAAFDSQTSNLPGFALGDLDERQVGTAAALSGQRRDEQRKATHRDPTVQPATHGSTILARKPPRGRLSKVTVPPWACAIACAIARPRPTPPVSRLRDCSSR